MKPDKAIEILVHLGEPIREDENPDIPDAIQLGIEALDRVMVARMRKEPLWGSLLPSETEE